MIPRGFRGGNGMTVAHQQFRNSGILIMRTSGPLKVVRVAVNWDFLRRLKCIPVTMAGIEFP